MGTSKIFFKKYIVTKSYPQVITKKDVYFVVIKRLIHIQRITLS